MGRKIAVLLTAVALATLFAPSSPSAQLRSAKGRLVKNEHATVSLKNGGIIIKGYRFVRPTRLMQKMPLTDTGPYLLVDVYNEGAEKQDFGIAAALFDRHGRLVGAGSGEKTGKLDPYEQGEVKVVFRDVNADAPHATTLQISLELRR